MTAQASSIQESVRKGHIALQEILSDEELAALFAKHHVLDERKRKLFVRCFFWLMIFSTGESSHRGSLLQLIGFLLGAAALLFPGNEMTSLSKSAMSKRLKDIPWYLFRGVYNDLLEQYQEKLDVRDTKYLGRLKDAFAIDGSVIALCKRMEGVNHRRLVDRIKMARLNAVVIAYYFTCSLDTVI